MPSESLVERARALPAWSPLRLHDCGGEALKLIHATVKQFDFDVHKRPETLICVKGAYAIETPDGEIAIPEGAVFTVPPGLKHRPANRETCIILVLG